MRAFTIIEILVTFLILSLIIGGAFAVLNVANLSWNTSLGMLGLEQGVRQAMDGMTREARQSRPSNVDVHNGGSQLDFYLPNITPVISYYVQNNQLIREHPNGTRQVLANDINNVNFCCVGGADCYDCSNSRILQIQLQASKSVRNAPLSFSLAEQVKLRNE
jgi:hypothetical protein